MSFDLHRTGLWSNLAHILSATMLMFRRWNPEARPSSNINALPIFQRAVFPWKYIIFLPHSPPSYSLLSVFDKYTAIPPHKTARETYSAEGPGSDWLYVITAVKGHRRWVEGFGERHSLGISGRIRHFDGSRLYSDHMNSEDSRTIEKLRRSSWNWIIRVWKLLQPWSY